MLLNKINLAIGALNQVLELGEKRYPDDKWRKQSIYFHLWRCCKHIIRWYINIDHSEDHLGHALTRLAFVVQLCKENDSISYKN